MTKIMYFGIGCFHFGLHETAERGFDGQRYVDEIRMVLESIPSIDDIELRGPPELLVVTWEVEDPPPSMSQGQGHFPDLAGSTATGLQVEFNVRIPYRIQSDLFETEPDLLTTGTERFRVTYDYSYYGPVAFVIPIDAKQGSSPADGVRVVRDFLSEEFRRSDTKFIRFEVLGPSPLHTECVLQPSTASEQKLLTHSGPFDCKEELSTGYSTTTFSYDPEVFSTAEDAFGTLRHNSVSELGFYYHLRRYEDSKIHAWSDIERLTQTLAELQNRKGLRARLQRSFTSAKPTTEGFIKLAQYESSEIVHKSAMQRDYSDIYSTGDPPCFKRHLDSLIDESFTAPTGPALRILQLTEARHVKRIDTIALLISSVLGGAIGALLTLWAAK
jgi:hypothetical protein